MNTVNLIGRLGADPIVRYTPNGTAVSNLSIAVDEFAQGKKETIWIKATAWTKAAEILAEHARKGSQIGITGRLTANNWQDANGENRHELIVTVEKVQLLDKPSKAPKTDAPATGLETKNEVEPPKAIDADDIPF